MWVLLGTFVPHTLRWWSGGRVTEQQLWRQCVPQILYPAWSLKGFSVWNASGRSLLRLRTSFPVEHLPSGIQAEDSTQHWNIPSTNVWEPRTPCTAKLPATDLAQLFYVYICKPYNYNVWPSLILECICLHKILTKEVLFPSFPKVTYDACGRAGKRRSSKSQASSQTTPPSFLLRMTTTSSQCGTLIELFFHAGR